MLKERIVEALKFSKDSLVEAGIIKGLMEIEYKMCISQLAGDILIADAIEGRDDVSAKDISIEILKTPIPKQ